MNDRIKTTSTSRHTADVEPIVLREGEAVRLVFHPMLVENARTPEAAVRGVFTYQRKGPHDEWEDVRRLDLSRLRKGESVQLELHSDELLRLVKGVRPLYDIVGEYGIPFGENEFVAAGPSYWAALLEDPRLRDATFSDEELSALRALASWVYERPAEAALAFEAIGTGELAAVEAAAGIARLRKFLSDWEANRDNPSEEYWQKLLTRESWVLGQLFGAPFVIVGERLYVGGKTYENREGRIADFLYKNRLTGNVLIIEIKTPVTPLLANAEYRAGIVPPAASLTGAITQTLDQRQTLIESHQQLRLDRTGAIPLYPRAVVLAGDMKRQRIFDDRLRSFELFRNELRAVEVVTFDELAAKAGALLELFRS